MATICQMSFPVVFFHRTVLLLCLLSFITRTLGNGQFSDGVGNILNLVQDTLSNIQDYVGEKGGCTFTCPKGTKLKPNPHHIKSSNGCGAFGFQLDLPIKKLTECCNEHDLCYDTCNKSKKGCDNSFKECLEHLCHKMKRSVTEDGFQGCMSGADMMHAATVALGCKPYKGSQGNACLCEPTRRTHFDL